MTEIDRIINKGLVTPDYLKREIICDFLVDEKRKRIWAVELDLIQEFDCICRKHHLNYFLMFGSLLGAIRHNGFIPWDDDIDVGMLRDDYEKLLSLKDEFHSPYFLQTPYTDDGYFYSYAKVRNSNTTGLTTNFQYQNINWGIMLDIYPLDKFIWNGAEDRYKAVSELAIDNSNFMRKSQPNPSQSEKNRIAKYSGRNPLHNYEEIQRISTQFNNTESDLLSVSCLTLYSLERNVFYKQDFDALEYQDFEGLQLPIPKGYDRILNTIYPNYMQLPPINQRGEWHSNVIFDPDKPYTAYLTK